MLTSGTKSLNIDKKQPSPAVPQRKNAHQPKSQAIEIRSYRARASRVTHHPSHHPSGAIASRWFLTIKKVRFSLPLLRRILKTNLESHPIFLTINLWATVNPVYSLNPELTHIIIVGPLANQKSIIMKYLLVMLLKCQNIIV